MQNGVMPSLHKVLQALETVAPARFAFEWDKVGLQVGTPDAGVSKAVVSLDRSLAAAQYSKEHGAQLLLSHHPLIFQPLSSLVDKTHQAKTARLLIQNDINFVAAHTNWDSAKGGINDTLAKRLELQFVQPFGSSAHVDQLKLIFFTPYEALNKLLDALSEAGAGKIGLYRRCAYMSVGIGTFEGLEGSNPTVGEAGKVEEVPETRVEMVLNTKDRDKVLDALRKNHPYEEPAWNLFHIDSLAEQPAGRIGILPQPMSITEFATHVDRKLGTRSWTWGEPRSKVQRIALVGGAADSEWPAAQALGADLYLTGEVKQHVALEAEESGLPIVAAGHYATEQPGVVELAKRMEALVPEVEWLVFEPAPGQAGRPF
jgi:dinuclear metal center YbgI/SA1388 family protein